MELFTRSTRHKINKPFQTLEDPMFNKIAHLKSASFILLAGLVILAGCNPKPKEVRLTGTDNGGTITLTKGETLILDLDSNPSTGYQWSVDEINEQILKQKGEAVFSQPTSAGEPLLGAGGTETFHFEAAGKGQVTLKLNYRRSWEKDIEPEATFAIQIEVR
jgi:inhibitor of cysteine peptidase